MRRKLTPSSTLANLKKEARRWLEALHGGDEAARERFERAHPNAPSQPGLRQVQHALAREHGLAGWTALKAALAARSPVQALLGAAAAGDVDQVRALLDEHQGIVNERGELPGHTGLRSALHYAVGGSHTSVVSALLQARADPNIRCEGDHATPLHFAAEREHLDIIQLLVEHGADPIAAGDGHELEVIGWATCFGTGRPDIVRYLLDHGARHTIFSAVATGAIGAIQELVARSADGLERPMDATNHRRRPLHLAVVKKQPDSLDTLLDLGADSEAVDAAGLTPLDQAALDSEMGMVSRLLAHGARIRLPAAVALDRRADIERLLREDPDALRANHRLGTLIVRAAARAPGRVITAMIRAGASPNAVDDPVTAVDGAPGYTALHSAAFNGNVDAVEALLREGADPAARDRRYGGSPAGWAAYAGHERAKDMVLRGTIDIFDAIDFDLPERIPDILARDPDALRRPFGAYVSVAPRPGQWWPEPATTPLAWAEKRGKGRAAATLSERADGGRDERVARFVRNACPDHHIRGPWAHPVARRTAERLLARHPEIARDSLYTAIICGDRDAVVRTLAERPEAATERGGPKGWTPLLYLCFTRLSLRSVRENAVAIARGLLEAGADPNAWFMAGDSRYTPLVGVIGEGEEGRPAHPARDDLVKLLLDRGAEPYDLQVVYNTHFKGDVLWLLELIHARAQQLGRSADWDDPLWCMLDMGGYGSGARYLLDVAIGRNDLALASWLLRHGASPNAPPARDRRLSQLSLVDEALRRGFTDMADLLVRHGAKEARAAITVEPDFAAACFRLEEAKARALLDRHPELRDDPSVLFAAAARDRADVVALLLDLGFPIEMTHREGQRVLHEAAFHGATRVAALLLERGADVDAREPRFGGTPLGWAVYGQHQAIIDLLSSSSRDLPNLIFAGKVDRVRALIRAEPALVRSRDAGDTLLMWLPDDESGARELAELLLELGVDPSVRNGEGKTAADIARGRGLDGVAALLERR